MNLSKRSKVTERHADLTTIEDLETYQKSIHKGVSYSSVILYCVLKSILELMS